MTRPTIPCAYCGVRWPLTGEHFPNTAYAECWWCVEGRALDSAFRWARLPWWRRWPRRWRG